MPRTKTKTKKRVAAKAKMAPYSHHMHHVNWRFVATVAMVVVALLFIILLSYMSTIREAVSAGNISM